MDRRELLATILTAPFLNAQVRSSEAKLQIFEAVWRAVRDQFYDPQTRGVDWTAIRDEFLPKARACDSDGQLLCLLRKMLSRLRNSHIFLYSVEEWEWRKNVLPFCFDKIGNRVFVRCSLQAKELGALPALELGDEILAVDGIPASRLRPPTIARLDSIKDSPQYGPALSSAQAEFRRAGKQSVVKLRRVIRPDGMKSVILAHPRPGIVHLRFYSLASRELPAAKLQHLWDEVTPARGLALDLRNCIGGDSEVSSFIAGSLLGPGKPLFRTIPRPSSGADEVLDQTNALAPRFNGRVAVLVNSNTESQPEILAAICREYGCARLIGERTAGAFNGWTIAIELPYHFAMFALPYTRSVSPKGIEYEGRGVEPDEPATNTIADFEAKRDKPLLSALQYLEA